jgi:CBS domain-containing protein
MTSSNDMVDVFTLPISDQDIYQAMKEIPGYLDITPGDFKDLYKLVYRHTLQRIAESIKAVDIMTRVVVTVQPDTPVQEAANLMAVKEVSGVPVVDSTRHVVGVLSEKDFLSRMGSGGPKTFMDVVARCLVAKGCAALEIREKKVEDIMTSPAVTVEENISLLEVSALFKAKKINRVPVIDQQGILTGILSREDIVHAPLTLGIS